MKALHKILVLRFSSLGDIVMSTAMIRCLRKRFPNAQIDMVVREDFLDVIRHNPHLDQTFALARRDGIRGLWRLYRHIQREHYDLIYDAHRSLRTRCLMPSLRADYKCYFEKKYVRRALALTFKIRLLSKRRMLETYLEPLEPWGVRYDGLGPELFIPHEVEERALKGLGPHVTTETLVGLIPSAQWPGKRWPASYFREVLGALLEETNNCFVLFGGNRDSFCRDITEGFPRSRVLNLQGQLSILEAASILRRCAYVIANDTGLMHVADSVGVPCILVLGPTSSELGCLPFHPRHRVVEESMWCRPCSKNGQAPCIRWKRHCLHQVTPLRVKTAALQLMKDLSVGLS